MDYRRGQFIQLKPNHEKLNHLVVAIGESPSDRDSPVAFSRNDQISYLAMTAVAGFTLILARMLTPSSAGYGTHEQMGLPPCLFFKLTGLPCPNCGLTTSFAHSARFHFYQAFIAQPFGLIAFFLTVASIPFFVFLFRRRIPWSEFIRAKGLDRLIYVLITIYLLSWVYKIAAIKLTGN